MSTLSLWLRAAGWFAVPHWVMLAVPCLLVFERLLGKSKNPAARSIIALVAMGLRWIFNLAHLGAIPVVGPMIIKACEVVAGIDLDGDGKIGDTTITVAQTLTTDVTVHTETPEDPTVPGKKLP